MARTAQVPEIQIRPDAERYILEGGGNVFIRPSLRLGCCGGQANVPVIDLGQPRDSFGYQTILLEGIAVHLHKEIALSKALIIGISGIRKWQKLWIDGPEITM